MQCFHHHPAASIGITLKYQCWLTNIVNIILKNKIGLSKFVFFGHGHKYLKYNSKITKYANYAKYSKYAKCQNSQTKYMKFTKGAKYPKYTKYEKYAKHAKCLKYAKYNIHKIHKSINQSINISTKLGNLAKQ